MVEDEDVWHGDGEGEHIRWDGMGWVGKSGIAEAGVLEGREVEREERCRRRGKTGSNDGLENGGVGVGVGVGIGGGVRWWRAPVGRQVVWYSMLLLSQWHSGAPVQ